ncbi:hypothetical protein [Rhodococcus sp. WB9]|uniref:hypothetical protein n=1 Tax=Rhodococcus sp. WB9 TaxID=2594007 RepID=UPI0021B2B236|nr:hypothetical protein [Rhodococcus sp. WB9]
MTAFGWGRQRTDHTPFEGGARGLSGKRWIALCASAEAVGMTAAAVAAKLSQHVLGGQPRGWDAALALLLVVAGGLVEGAALGRENIPVQARSGDISTRQASTPGRVVLPP